MALYLIGDLLIDPVLVPSITNCELLANSLLEIDLVYTSYSDLIYFEKLVDIYSKVLFTCCENSEEFIDSAFKSQRVMDNLNYLLINDGEDIYVGNIVKDLLGILCKNPDFRQQWVSLLSEAIQHWDSKQNAGEIFSMTLNALDQTADQAFFVENQYFHFILENLSAFERDLISPALDVLHKSCSWFNAEDLPPNFIEIRNTYLLGDSKNVHINNLIDLQERISHAIIEEIIEALSIQVEEP
eukprot:TRINITY_DN11328_c0_g1_i1.p1 TRINITY_DN11328_c0_g1~~TRINITY_DN11328_c0_g1_i1.p1  ORF type:complete len:242 (-),score=35.79 TRINITY_DN11328_c0_g1_i1:42-767(-)